MYTRTREDLVKTRCRMVGLAFGAILITACGLALIGGRRYVVAIPSSANTTPALIATVLNGNESQARSAADILAERDVPVERYVLNASQIGWRTRAEDFARSFDDPALSQAVLQGQMQAFDYEEARAKFLACQEDHLADYYANSMIDFDAFRAQRELPGLMQQRNYKTLAWTRVDSDPGLLFADAWARQQKAKGTPFYDIYLRLATHPAVTSERQLVGVLGRSGVAIGRIDPWVKYGVDRAFRNRYLFQSHVFRSSKILGQKGAPMSGDEVKRITSKHILIRQRAEALLAANSPEKLRPTLLRYLSSNQAPLVERAVRLEVKDVDALTKLLDHPDQSVRIQVAIGLRCIGTARALSALKLLKNDPAKDVRAAALD